MQMLDAQRGSMDLHHSIRTAGERVRAAGDPSHQNCAPIQISARLDADVWLYWSRARRGKAGFASERVAPHRARYSLCGTSCRDDLVVRAESFYRERLGIAPVTRQP